MLPLIVVTKATDKVALVLVGKGCVTVLDVASYPIPEFAGTAIQEVERLFKMTAGRAVRSGSFVKQPLAGHYRVRWEVTFESRTAAGPSTTEQCVLSGGPYTIRSQVRHVQVVWPPP